MKIYATDASEHEILKFVGKDVWVKCYSIDPEDDRRGRDYYIRAKGTFLGADNSTMIVHCNVVDSEAIDAGEFLSKYSYAREQIGEKCLLILNRIRLTHPLEILTDEELMASISDFNILTKFVGKDYWIKVYRNGDRNDFDTFFLHINSRDGYRIVGDWIEAEYVDNYRYDGTHSGPPSKFVEPVGMSYRDIRDFEVVRPMEVLTNDEVYTMLAENDEVYKEGYRNDEGEEYEW